MAFASQLGLDMNDSSTLSYYSQLLLFKHDTSQTVISFENPTKPQQRALQSLAHALELEYDHNTLIRQAIISRQGLWESTLNNSENHVAEPTTAGWGDQRESPPMTMRPFALNPSMIGQPISEVHTAHFADVGPFSPDIVDDENDEFAGVQSLDWTAGEIGNLSTYQVEQDVVSGPLDDASVDYSVDTVPSISETSGVAQISSASDLYSSRELSSHNLHDRCLCSSSAVNDNRHGSCQSIHAAISGFFNGSYRTTSRAASINSIYSERGRNRVEKGISRRSSIRSAASSGFSCFDSRSDRSESQVSLSSGRRGPLGKIARATMKMVTAAKACWRCKILRKGCSPETPCDTCPKDARRSDWHILGCKRGEIKDHMLPVLLCAKHNPGRPEDSSVQFPVNPPQATANEIARQGQNQREAEIRLLRTASQGEQNTLLGDFLQMIGMDLRSLDTLRGIPVLSTSLGRPLPPSIVPLDDCVLMILWELLSNPRSQYIHDEWTTHEFFNLLIAAALCQVDTGNRLIAQSFVCLRSCLEVLRVQASGYLYDSFHLNCDATLCNIECIANLEEQLSQYLDELSRVFFAKENMRDIKIWWMSGFYSLCIQSIVRRTLIYLLENTSANPSPSRHLGVKQYLQVAVRLFVAGSRIHDPLVRDLPHSCESTCTEEEICKINECKLAQISVKQPTWKESGIKSSGAYLKHLFEDNDQILLTSTAEAGVGDLCPEFDSAFKPYSWLTKFKTVFLINDSSSLSGSSSWNEISGALSSIMFLVNRYHNYGIDIYFANHKSLGQGDLSEGIAPGGYHEVKNIATVTEIFKKIKPDGSISTSSRIRDILWPHLENFERVTSQGEELRPLNLIVITDTLDDGGIESELFFIAKKLDEIHAPRQQVAVQFFEVRSDGGCQISGLVDKGTKLTTNDHVGARHIASKLSYTDNGQFSGDAILKANLDAWLRLLES